MKKILLGCAGVLVLVAVVGGVAAYYFVWRPASSYIASFSQLQEIPKLEAQVQNKTAFVPPDTGELTAAMVDRYLGTQRSIQERLGGRLNELDAKYKALNAENGNEPSFGDALTALKDLGDLIVEAKRAQVQAMNAHGFSMEEYEWVRGSVYAAAGIPLHGNFRLAIEQASEGGARAAESSQDAVIGEVPEANRALVQPHLELLRDRVALAFFGM